MGAPNEMGWDESCLWGPALSSVVQSLYRAASEAPPAVTARSPGRVGVFCLRKRPVKLSLKQNFLCGLSWN